MTKRWRTCYLVLEARFVEAVGQVQNIRPHRDGAVDSGRGRAALKAFRRGGLWTTPLDVCRLGIAEAERNRCPRC